MAEKKHRVAGKRRLIEQKEPRRRAVDYVVDPRRKLETAVEGDPERLRAIARARRNKGGG